MVRCEKRTDTGGFGSRPEGGGKHSLGLHPRADTKFVERRQGSQDG